MTASARFTPTPIKGANGWNVLRIGAGGYVTGLQFSADGLAAVISTDVGGGYYAESPNWTWRQIISRTSLPAAVFPANADGTGFGDGMYSSEGGLYAAAIAPSDKNRVYVAGWNGYLLKSTDKGLTFSQTTLPRTKMFSNSGGNRFGGDKLVVDPLNPDVVYFIGMDTGLWRTLDGGTNWTQVASITPTGIDDDKRGSIVIDQTSADAGSGATLRKSGVYASSSGNGFYGSTDGGGTFSLLSAAEGNATHMVVDALGAVYICHGNSNLKRWESGAMSANLLSFASHTVAVDPVNNNKIIVLDIDGASAVTDDRGGRWSVRNNGVNNNNVYSWVQQASDIPWLTKSADDNPSRIRFRPGTSELWKPNGIGVFRCASFPDYGTETLANRPLWTSVSAGIEELAAKHIVSPPNAAPLFLFMDRPIFRSGNHDAFPVSYGPDATLRHGVGADYAKDNPNYIAMICSKFGKNPMDYSSYSYDGGRTWTKFPSAPLMVEGGCMAVGNAGNIVVLPGANSTPVYTVDNGTTWTPITFPAGGPQIPTGGAENGFGFGVAGSQWLQVATHDGTNFYILNYGPAAVPSLAGVWRSSNGVTWTQRTATNPIIGGGFNGTMKAPFGKTGHLFATAGPIGSQGSPVMDGGDFMFSSDGGATFNAIPNFKEVTFFGFGKAASGADYPAIWAYGYRNSVFSMWWCTNFNPADRSGTWTDVGLPASFDIIRTVEGDRNVFGKVYVGFSGSGMNYGNFG